MKISLIIAGAGNSKRMGGVNKQFSKINSVPVIVKSVLAFENFLEIEEILVVAKEEDIPQMRTLCERYKVKKPIKFVIGGQTRQASVKNALNAISMHSDYIAIHDGARPLVENECIQTAIKNALKYKATALAVPVKDTIKVVDKNGFIKDTPDRNALFITQTPQIFEKKLYLKAMNNALEKGLDLTDDCQLVEAIGQNVYITLGSYQNIKITTVEDIMLANIIDSDCNSLC